MIFCTHVLWQRFLRKLTLLKGCLILGLKNSEDVTLQRSMQFVSRTGCHSTLIRNFSCRISSLEDLSVQTYRSYTRLLNHRNSTFPSSNDFSLNCMFNQLSAWREVAPHRKTNFSFFFVIQHTILPSISVQFVQFTRGELFRFCTTHIRWHYVFLWKF